MTQKEPLSVIAKKHLKQIVWRYDYHLFREIWFNDDYDLPDNNLKFVFNNILLEVKQDAFKKAWYTLEPWQRFRLQILFNGKIPCLKNYPDLPQPCQFQAGELVQVKIDNQPQWYFVVAPINLRDTLPAVAKSEPAYYLEHANHNIIRWALARNIKQY